MTIPTFISANKSREEMLSRYLELRDSGELHCNEARRLEDRLLRSYERLVRFVTSERYAKLPPYVAGVLDRDDLRAVGLCGLQKALREFDPERGNFANHAIKTISRAMADEVKKLDPLSSEARWMSRKAENAAHRLAGELGRQPSDEELAAEIGVSPERASNLRTWYARATSESLDDEEASEVPAAEPEIPDPESEELREALDRAMEGIPEGERKALNLRRENLTYREIGEEIAITTDSAKRKVKQATCRIKANLTEFASG